MISLKYGYGKDNRGGTGVSFNGIINSVRIYNRKLSESEIKQNYVIDKSRFNF